MNRKICIVGLGYVGLPLAVEFGKKFKVFGFDINKKRINELQKNYDFNNEIASEDIKRAQVVFSSNVSVIKKSDFIIVAVPTPVDKKNRPDLSLLIKAAKLVGKNLQNNSIVVFESTVYPGTTEEVCTPILEKESGLKYKSNFKVGYSPERVNPGDKKHTIDKIVKVVSGCDKKTVEEIAQAYNTIVKPGVYKAKSIKVAEAAKVIENIQRDLNIALMNELQMIFDKMNIKTKDVLKAAKTKWNFLNFSPGLVGGHCISVDPYYLAYKSKIVGHQPKLILVGRETNECMVNWEFKKIIKKIKKEKINLRKAKVLILGATFKPDVKDLRNSKVKNLVGLLINNGCQVVVCEPMIPEKKRLFNCPNVDFKNIKLEKFDFVIKAVNHKIFSIFPRKKIIHLFE